MHTVETTGFIGAGVSSQSHPDIRIRMRPWREGRFGVLIYWTILDAAFQCGGHPRCPPVGNNTRRSAVQSNIPDSRLIWRVGYFNNKFHMRHRTWGRRAAASMCQLLPGLLGGLTAVQPP